MDAEGVQTLKAFMLFAEHVRSGALQCVYTVLAPMQDAFGMISLVSRAV